MYMEASKSPKLYEGRGVERMQKSVHCPNPKKLIRVCHLRSYTSSASLKLVLWTVQIIILQALQSSQVPLPELCWLDQVHFAVSHYAQLITQFTAKLGVI